MISPIPIEVIQAGSTPIGILPGPQRGELTLAGLGLTEAQHPWFSVGVTPLADFLFSQGSTVDLINGAACTFTRPSSTKRFQDASGNWQTAAADVPTYAFDQTTGECLGIRLNCAATTNLFLNSATPGNRTIAVTAQQYTLSFYGTGTISLSGASTAGPLVGTGASSRVKLTFTTTTGNLTLTPSGPITQPQLEFGPIATPPIVTGGSLITRAADRLEVTAAEFAKIAWAGGPVVIYAEYQYPELLELVPQTLYSATSLSSVGISTGGELYSVEYSMDPTTGVIEPGARVAATTNSDVIIYTIPSPPTFQKTAWKLAATGGGFARNGVMESTYGITQVPTLIQRLLFGARYNYGLYPSRDLILRRFAIFPSDLGYPQLQAITTF